jgi:hypothetical protein
LASDPALLTDPARLFYQDGIFHRVFHADEIRTVDVEDIGTVVSVTLKLTVDLGATTFSLILPEVLLPDEINASAPIKAEGITTFHRSFLSGVGHAQRETYRTTRLSSDAVRGPLPV